MARYAVEYRETYSDTYVVEANSFEEAKDKLFDALCRGKVIEPEAFYEYDFADVTEDCKNIENAYVDVE